LVKEGELETRVNRLADIVDQWYRDAYVRGLTVRDTGAEVAGGSAPLVPQQQPTIVKQNSPAAQRFQDSNASSQPFSVMGDAHKVGNKVAHPQAASTRVAVAWNSANAGKKDISVDDIGIGHLSVAEGGRSRYVGNSYWALLSNEVTTLENDDRLLH
jgi:hypothetical protein